ncbi:MAG: ribosome rescue GTPase HflX [Pseudomonadota bacterium]
MLFDRPGETVATSGLLSRESDSDAERVVLVSLELDSDRLGGFRSSSDTPPGPSHSAPMDSAEFEELVRSAGALPVAWIGGRRSAPSARLFVGAGKVEQIAEALSLYEASLVLFNHTLSPTQERNLERELKCRVLDRTGLILDIFAQRARTHEGKLQVELAQLEHMSTRLVRGWTHLERQKGGIGLRGPGETQLETDRRLLRARVRTIRGRLEKVRRQRSQGRRSRSRTETPTVALVGYTNAGKSTLFNALTDANVYAADKLFATLDPTLRRISVQNLGAVVLADTVGFISSLPHGLIEAFKATLEETRDADLLLHVIDASDQDRDSHCADVHEVLAEMGADTIPVLQVYNKIDLLELEPRLDRDDAGHIHRVWISATQPSGLAMLQQAVAERLSGDVYVDQIDLQPSQAKLRAELYELGAVEKEQFLENGTAQLHVRLARRDWERLVAQHP